MLIALAGLPGSGKTTVSRALARHLGAVWLRMDTIEGAMLRAGLSPDAVGAAGYGVGMGSPPIIWAGVLNCGYEPWQGDRLVVDTAVLTPGLTLATVLAALPASTRPAA